ncbi:MAG: hypothetical protein IJT44_02475 [Clostridia bacterium]|nr:hypothetical protein [Clostridia bacterium]
MKKKVLSFLLIALMLFASAFSASAAYTYGRGADSDQEGNKTVGALYIDIYDTYGVDAFFIRATEYNGEGSAQEFANVAVGNLTNEADHILFVATEDDSYILTGGKCTDMIDDASLAKLYSACQEYLDVDDYGIAATMFFAQVKMILAQISDPQSVVTVAVKPVEETPEDETEPADATDPTEEPTVLLYGVGEVEEPTMVAAPPSAPAQKTSVVKALVICLVIGAVIALIVVFAVKSSYKPVQKKANANEYLVDGSLNITASNEKFIRKETSERKISTNK